MKKHIALHVAIAIAFALIGTTVGWYAHSWSSVKMTARNSTLSDPQESIESSVYYELRNNVEDGTTIDELREIVGDSFIKQNYNIPEEISESFRRTLVARGVMPEPDDEYCALLLGSRTIILHFQGGRLVNLRPEADFASPEDVEFMISMHSLPRQCAHHLEIDEYYFPGSFDITKRCTRSAKMFPVCLRREVATLHF